MSTVPAEEEVVLGPESAGVLMTPEEFDAIDEYDENYRYELVQGVLVVTPVPLAEETGPNELLGRLLLNYQEDHPQGSALDYTLPQQYVRTSRSRRLADRLIWTGLGRLPNRQRDLPSIAVEFVSAGRRNRQRDYVDKRQEYMEVGISEYWIIDRFRRTLTVIQNKPTGPEERVIAENETYQSALLPGFEVPLARLLEAADRMAQTE
ncbi:MAG TPA: Uma2 family endonuclease [Gemmataceae bacterium]|jgi:Uma2 family endonuclease|nr:Uma2 family endonuclease [Gemmataceae bacterium]